MEGDLEYIHHLLSLPSCSPIERKGRSDEQIRLLQLLPLVGPRQTTRYKNDIVQSATKNEMFTKTTTTAMKLDRANSLILYA